jgi:plastocyanin
MKENIYYAGFLATVLLVFVATGPVISATTTDTTQSLGTTNQTQTSQEGTVRVAIGEGSNATIQHYTFTPQSVEINAGESVTWVSPSELSDIHTVTFADPNVISAIILPFAVSGDTNFELVPPFNLGEPDMIQAPDGRQAIVALNKHAWNPAVVDANNQTTYLNGTDIRYTMDGTEKVINSGIILALMPPTGGAVDQNSSGAATGGQEIPRGGAALTNETTPTSNTTAQATEGGGGQPPIGPPFPPVSSFTVTFQKPGTYPYFCAIHPWMTGQVIVRGGNQTAAEGGNQTGTQEQNGAGALSSLFE